MVDERGEAGHSLYMGLGSESCEGQVDGRGEARRDEVGRSCQRR